MAPPPPLGLWADHSTDDPSVLMQTARVIITGICKKEGEVARTFSKWLAYGTMSEMQPLAKSLPSLDMPTFFHPPQPPTPTTVRTTWNMESRPVLHAESPCHLCLSIAPLVGALLANWFPTPLVGFHQPTLVSAENYRSPLAGITVGKNTRMPTTPPILICLT